MANKWYIRILRSQLLKVWALTVLIIVGFIAPLTFSQYKLPIEPDFQKWIFLLRISISVSVAGYVHYELLYRRFAKKGKIGRYLLLVVLLLSVVILYERIVIAEAISGFNNFLTYVAIILMVFYVPVVTYYAASERLKVNKGRHEDLQHQQRANSLLLLKSKLEPHFLFNTLNTIYAIAQKEQASKTVTFIDGLSDRLRDIMKGSAKRGGSSNADGIRGETESRRSKYGLAKEVYSQFIAVLLIFSVLSLASLVIVYQLSGTEKLSNYPNYFVFLFFTNLTKTFAVVSHYYILYRPYIMTGRYKQYFLWLLPFILLVYAVDLCVNGMRYHIPLPDSAQYDWRYVLPISFSNVVMRNSAAILIYAVIRHYMLVKKQKNNVERKYRESNLQLLQSNVDTTMLHQSLNKLQAVAANEQAPQTQVAVQQLTDLFRYSNEQANKETVPVREEVNFIERYIQLQQLRVQQSDDIEIKTSITCDNENLKIAPMLLLPFVENAFKFGISYEQPSEISIDIRFENNRMECHIVNTDHSQLKHYKSSGIGIANTVKRLALQYQGRYELEYGTKDGIYSVHLSVDLNR